MARDLYSQMAQAVIDGEADEAAELARQGLAEGLPAADIIDKGFVKGIEEVPVICAPAPAAGVSTQRVDKLVRQLGIDGISKSQASRLAVTHDETVEAIRGRPLETTHPHLALDALQVKVREAGCTVSVACGTDADRRYVSLEAHPTHSRSATPRPPRRCG